MTITELALHWSTSDEQDCVTVERPDDITLPATSLGNILLEATAVREGTTSLESVSFRLNGTFKSIESLKKQGPRLNNSKAHFETPTYERDRSLELRVRGNDVALVARLDDCPSSIIAGELINASISFTNNGIQAVRNLRLLCSSPHIVEHLIEGAHSGNLVTPDSGTMTLKNELAIPRPDEILDNLPSGESYTLSIAIRVADTGKHSVGWLAVFENETEVRHESASSVRCTEEAIRVGLRPALCDLPIRLKSDLACEPR